jgi:hypothetical protein
MIPGLLSKVPDLMAKFTGEPPAVKEEGHKETNVYHKMKE